MTTITVNDGKTTPVAHVFTLVKSENGIAVLRDLEASPFNIADTLTVSHSETNKLRVVKVALRRPRAVDEVINGVTTTKMADFASAGVQINIPATWAEADIKDCRVMMANALANALIVAAVEDGIHVS